MSNPDLSPEQVMDFGPFRKHPVESLRNSSVSGKAMLNLIGACSVLADEIEKEAPEILFIALRGASPIRLLTEEFIEGQDRKPQVVELPIGSYSYIDYKGESPYLRLSGMSFKDKELIVSETFERLENAGKYVPGETKMMLVDEVQYGSTIVDAAKAVRHGMRERGDNSRLNVFSVKDGRTASKRTDKYANFVRSDEVKDLGTTVDSLFIVDAGGILDGLFNTHPSEIPSLDTIKVVPNLRARQFLKTLYSLYNNPASVDKAVSLLTTTQPSDIILPPELTHIRGLGNRLKADEKHIFEWVQMFSKAVKKHRASQL